MRIVVNDHDRIGHVSVGGGLVYAAQATVGGIEGFAPVVPETLQT